MFDRVKADWGVVSWVLQVGWCFAAVVSSLWHARCSLVAVVANAVTEALPLHSLTLLAAAPRPLSPRLPPAPCEQVIRVMHEALFAGCEVKPDTCKALAGLATLHGGGSGMKDFKIGGEHVARLLTLTSLHSAINDPLEPLLEKMWL